MGRVLFHDRKDAMRRQAELVALARQGKANPENERLILRLADCYLRAGDTERALSAYWHVVDIYKRRSDWQKAAAVLKRILHLGPDRTIAHFELAQCYEKLDRKHEASQQWEQAGQLYKAAQDTEGAIRCFIRALALDPLQQRIAHEISRLRPRPQVMPLGEPAAPAPVRPDIASLARARAIDRVPEPVREHREEDQRTLLSEDFDAETVAVGHQLASR